MGKFKISIIIPVKNGAVTLKQCLTSISIQSIANDFEIIIFDSMSTDTSREIALSFGAKVIDVPEGTFNHGLTRQSGANIASGDLLFYTVQDAWLSENDCLEKMSSHFNDMQVQAVVGHQAVTWGDQDKNPVYWFKRYSEPETEIRFFPNSSFQRLSAKQQFELSNWDDVNAMYRKSALMELPFRKTSYSEDWLWANDALKKGMKILRDPSLVVYHYHHMAFFYTFKTQFIVDYNFYNQFNIRRDIAWSPMALVRACYILLKRKDIKMYKKPYWILHNLSINFALFSSSLVFNTGLVSGGNRLLKKINDILVKAVPQGKVK